jgi:hypothetical protein
MSIIQARRSVLTIVIGYTALFMFVQSAVANITYNLVSYSDYQNGYNLTGTLTTNGHIGMLAQSDIITGTITVSNGVNTYQNLLPNDIYWNNDLLATDNQLSLSMKTADSYSQIWSPGFALGGGPYGTPLIYYDYFQNPPDTQNPGTIYVGSSSSVYYSTTVMHLWDTTPISSPQLAAQLATQLGGQPWIIAKVPEPTTITLLVTAIGSVLILRRWRVSTMASNNDARYSGDQHT